MAAPVDWTEPRRRLSRIEVSASAVTMRLKREVGDPSDIPHRLAPDDRCSASDDGVAVVVPFRLARRAGGVVALNAAGGDAIDRPRRDPALSTALVRAEAWKRKLLAGEVATVDDLARAEGVAPTYAARLLRTAFLAGNCRRQNLTERAPAETQGVFQGELREILWSGDGVFVSRRRQVAEIWGLFARVKSRRIRA